MQGGTGARPEEAAGGDLAVADWAAADWVPPSSVSALL